MSIEEALALAAGAGNLSANERAFWVMRAETGAGLVDYGILSLDEAEEWIGGGDVFPMIGCGE